MGIREITFTVPGQASGEVRSRLATFARKYPALSFETTVASDYENDVDRFTCRAEDIVLNEKWLLKGAHDRATGFMPLPGVSDFRHVPNQPQCSHCRTRRSSKHLLLLNSEDNEQIWVGLTCLPAFLNKSAKQVSSFNTMFFDPAAEARSITQSTDIAPKVDVISAIAAALMVVEEHGYLSHKQALRRGTLSTAQRIASMAAIDRETLKVQWAQSLESKLLPAALVHLWARNEMQPTTDFEHEIQRVAKRGAITTRGFGIIAAFPLAYSKARETEKALESGISVASDFINEHMGQVGQRLRLEHAHVQRTIALENGSTLVIFRSPQGHQLSWFASNDPHIKPGQVVQLTGTVKTQVLYNGKADTRLTRCRIDRD